MIDDCCDDGVGINIGNDNGEYAFDLCVKFNVLLQFVTAE